MGIDPRNVLLWIISIANVALGFLVVSKDRRNIINRSFAGFATAIAFWSFALIAFRTSLGPEVALLTIKLSYVAAIFIAVSFWEFALAFTNRPAPNPKERLLLWGSAFGISTALLMPKFLTHALILHSWGKSVILGVPEYLLFFVYFIFFFFGGLVLVGLHLRQEAGLKRLQARYIFWSVLLAGTGGVMFNLFMPSPFWEEWRLIWIGPIFTFLIVLFITYAIVKHGFLNIKAIAAELLTIALVAGLAIEIFLSPTLTAALFRLVILVFVSYSGILLVRSVILEIKRREEMERLSKELAFANAKLQELDQAKTDFMSLASHQLRSPLTVVKLGIGALLDGMFGKLRTKQQAATLHKMLESTDRLIHLISDYLNVSRIEIGKMKYEFEEQDLCALTADIVEEYGPKARAKGLKMTFKKIGVVSKIIFDDEKMRHVIMNIIDNAIKYTPQGSIAVRCQQAEAAGAAVVKISVQDTGLGLDQDDLAVLFQKFRRAGTAAGHLRRREAEPVEGSGLGMHVAKTFVEKHGGTIWAESPGRGKGSTFFVALLLSGPPPLPPDELGEGGKGVELPHP